MRLTACLVLCALGLSACLSEINKPIGPNDRWAETADLLTRPASPD